MVTNQIDESMPESSIEQLGPLFRNASFGAAAVDPLTGEIQYQNAQFAKYIGGSAAILPEVIEQLHSAPRISREIPVTGSLADVPPSTERRSQVTRTRQDGRHVAVQFWGHPICDDPEPVFLLFVDFAPERHSSADEVRQVSVAVEDSTQGASQLDSDGRFVFVKPHFAGLLGYEADELVGQSWLVTVPKDDRPVALAGHQKMLDSGRAELECSGRRKDGSTFEMQLMLVEIVNADGKHDGHYRFIRDITDRQRVEQSLRESEERLAKQLSEVEAVYRTAPVGLCLVDPELRYVRVNEKLASLHGRSVKDHLGCHLRDVLPEMADLLEPIYRCALDSGRAVSNLELERVDPQDPDESKTLLASFFPLRNERDQAIGVSTVVQDISERRKAEREIREHHLRIREMDAQLAHVSRLSTMGEMVAGIAHEIHQPLAAIANYASACRKTLGEPKDESEYPLQGWLQQISDQAMRCGNIIRRQREFVRKGEGGREPVDIDLVLQNSVALIACDARSQMIEAKPIVPGLLVYGDSVELQQVIVNLLRNALDATSRIPNPVVRMHSLLNEDSVTIFVEDNGPGIGLAQQEQLFDAFYSTKRNGIGMGLSISKSIVESHDGTLNVDASYTAGARFVLTLPLWKAGAEELA